MIGCSGVCSKYKAKKPSSQFSRYASGQKSCIYCEIFMDYEGNNCSCCNRQLRCLPRSRKGKDKYISQSI